MTFDEIKNNFKYHAPTDSQVDRYGDIRDKGHELALLINLNCPESREKSIAFTKIEEAIMWANASIARNEEENELSKDVL